MGTWTIDEIKGLSASYIESVAEETVDVKGHEVCFVDFGPGFGYSAVVVADGRQIHYANDYELHHKGKTREELREWYLDAMGRKLFTEEELRETSEEFDELQRKRHYLHNFYGDRRECQSVFCYGEPAEWYERERETAILNPVTFAYYHDYDRDFVERCKELHRALEAANDPLRDYEHAKAAFKYEMWNHEYAINWQGDWDVISCFCKVDYKGDGTELDQTGWSPEVKRAYRDAAHEVMASSDC